jgi:hypothetical protein
VWPTSASLAASWLPLRLVLLLYRHKLKAFCWDERAFCRFFDTQWRIFLAVGMHHDRLEGATFQDTRDFLKWRRIQSTASGMGWLVKEGLPFDTLTSIQT